MLAFLDVVREYAKTNSRLESHYKYGKIGLVTSGALVFEDDTFIPTLGSFKIADTARYTALMDRINGLPNMASMKITKDVMVVYGPPAPFFSCLSYDDLVVSPEGKTPSEKLWFITSMILFAAALGVRFIDES